MLSCIREFNQGGYQFAAGAIVALEAAAETWLIESYPAYFERYTPAVEAAQSAPAPADEARPADEPAEAAPALDDEPEVKDVAAPAVDKAIKRPRGRK